MERAVELARFGYQQAVFARETPTRHPLGAKPEPCGCCWFTEGPLHKLTAAGAHDHMRIKT
jgi:hypothetical protein